MKYRIVKRETRTEPVKEVKTRKDLTASMDYFVDHGACILCFILYFIVGVLLLNLAFDSILSFALSLVCYIVMIAMVWSDGGETIAQMMIGARPIKTMRDKEYLLPIFRASYEMAMEASPGMAKDIHLYIINSHEINACAYGRKTVAVSRGAIQSFTEEELKAVIAHELGHVANGDTRISLFLMAGNGFFSVLTIAIRAAVHGLKRFLDLFERGNLIRRVLRLVISLFNLAVGALNILSNILVTYNSRNNEYKADHFALACGYGASLVEALYKLDEIAYEAKTDIVSQFFMSHPFLTDRIEILEVALYEGLEGQE